jgi:osmotically-inducible protein OsmY
MTVNKIRSFVFVIWISILPGCTLCVVGAGGAGYAAGEASADNDRGVEDVLSDGVITMKVNAAFAVNENLSAWDINVDTRLKVVTLRGYVKSKETIDEAVKTAKDVKGVEKVKSLLVVDSSR